MTKGENSRNKPKKALNISFDPPMSLSPECHVRERDKNDEGTSCLIILLQSFPNVFPIFRLFPLKSYSLLLLCLKFNFPVPLESR